MKQISWTIFTAFVVVSALYVASVACENDGEFEIEEEIVEQTTAAPAPTYKKKVAYTTTTAKPCVCVCPKLEPGYKKFPEKIIEKVGLGAHKAVSSLIEFPGKFTKSVVTKVKNSVEKKQELDRKEKTVIEPKEDAESESTVPLTNSETFEPSVNAVTGLVPDLTNAVKNMGGTAGDLAGNVLQKGGKLIGSSGSSFGSLIKQVGGDSLAQVVPTGFGKLEQIASQLNPGQQSISIQANKPDAEETEPAVIVKPKIAAATPTVAVDAEVEVSRPTVAQGPAPEVALEVVPEVAPVTEDKDSDAQQFFCTSALKQLSLSIEQVANLMQPLLGKTKKLNKKQAIQSLIAKLQNVADAANKNAGSETMSALNELDRTVDENAPFFDKILTKFANIAAEVTKLHTITTQVRATCA